MEAAEHVEGMVAVGGVAVDTGRALRIVGIVVDSVSDVMELPPGSIRPPPEVESGINAGGIARTKADELCQASAWRLRARGGTEFLRWRWGCRKACAGGRRD